MFDPDKILPGLPPDSADFTRRVISALVDQDALSGTSPIRVSRFGDGITVDFDPHFEDLRLWTPTQFTADQNDFDIGGFNWIIMTSNAAINFNGMDRGCTGAKVYLTNSNTTNAITIKHQATGSAPFNRFFCPNQVDYVLPPGASVCALHDGNQWYVGAPVGGGDIINITKNGGIVYNYNQPPDISNNQDNYPIGGPLVYLNPITNNWYIGGINLTINNVSKVINNYEIHIKNVSPTYYLIFKHEKTTTTNIYRFKFPWATDVILPPGGKIILNYDPVLQRWVPQWPQIVEVKQPFPQGTITTDQNPLPTGVVRDNTIGSNNSTNTIRGIDNPWPGRRITVINTGTNPIPVTNEDGAATAVQRIKTPTAGTVNIPAQSVAGFIYDDGTSRWFMEQNFPSGGSTTSTNGTAFLGSDYITTSSFVSTGLTVTLPNIGTYLLTASVFATMSGGYAADDEVGAEMYNSTDSVNITGGWFMQAEVISLTKVDGATGLSAIVTTSGTNRTIQLRAARTGVGGTVKILSTDPGGGSANGTNLSYVQLS